MPDATDRRRRTRHSLRLKIPCSARRIVQEDAWPVKVRSLSAQWIKLSTAIAYGPGMHLTIDLPGLADPKVIRVVAADPQDKPDTFLLLAQFVKRLTRGEMDSLRARVQRRRTSLRRHSLRATCHRIRIVEDDPWLITAYNISGRGLGLFADRPIDPGTFLKLELPSLNRRQRRTKLLRVTRSRPGTEEGTWDLGGIFLKELTGDEIQALL